MKDKWIEIVDKAVEEARSLLHNSHIKADSRIRRIAQRRNVPEALIDRLLRDLVNQVADSRYLEKTQKTWEELNSSGYLSYERKSWADVVRPGEYDSIENAAYCALEMADQAIEAEQEQEIRRLCE